MNCPDCGVEVNEQASRCHSCGAIIHPREKSEPSAVESLTIRTKKKLPFIALAGYIILILLVTYPLFLVYQNRMKSEQLSDALDEIMKALNRFADDYNTFPPSIDLVIEQGYIVTYPDNPYQQRAMKPRDVGHPFSGDFTYLPLHDENGQIWGCILFGYGPDLDGGMDLLTESKNYSYITGFESEPDGKPDGIIHVRQAKRGTHRV